METRGSLEVSYGDIGDEGMISVKEHKDAATASKFADAKIAEKTKALVKNSFAEPADAGFTVVREGSVSVDGGEAYFYDLRWD